LKGDIDFVLYIFSRYKKLWAKHQKNVRGIPNWKTVLAFRDAKIPLQRVLSSSHSNSVSSGSSSRSISECWSPDIILEEAEEEELMSSTE
jgi:hypothetical protein